MIRNRWARRVAAWQADRAILSREPFTAGDLSGAWVDVLPAVAPSGLQRQCRENTAAGMRTYVVSSAGEPVGWTDVHGALVAPDEATADAWHAAVVRDPS